MSQSGDNDDVNPFSYLSWRKLQFHRAKLKASSKASPLLSGFAMVAMVNSQLAENITVLPSMLISFAIYTTLLVAVNILVLRVSTCILPNIKTGCNFPISICLVDESSLENW